MADTESGKEEIHVPGTIVLAFIFLTWFVASYFAAWWVLSHAWPVH